MIAQNGKLPGIQLREKKGSDLMLALKRKRLRSNSNQQSKLKQVCFSSLYTGKYELNSRTSKGLSNSFQGLRVNENY